ncbi:DUF2059 domain-containing protein [Tamlana fucoidanivorans]|uniref:DUF2059 domain-containing protein n=1 Tax=Allotamlana fucoidanivorans TaxID=2583814 RepID=A0A5C4SSD5_9FLAO|nr:DUF2059 domain-containing protein [Tamlana fucoidanivorans]TNJ47028.1 DUF2059 domain-containing protein [Tamlana fucoidanivorans]
MKKNLLICLFTIALSSTFYAQDNSGFKKETVEFIKITGAAKAFEKAIAQIGAMVPETNKEAYTNEANGTLEPLYNQMADLYMAEFTAAEITQLINFYKTDLGKKLASKQVELTQKAMAFGQSWGMKVQAIAQKYQ